MSFIITFHKTKDEFQGVLNMHFDRALRLRGEWEVGIITLYMPDAPSQIWAFSNVVDFSYVNEVPMQLLGILDGGELKTKKPLYYKVCKKTVPNINVELRQDPHSESFTLKTGIICVLHFRKA
jgi:hypothetical protein